VGRSVDEAGDVGRADQAVQAAKQQLAELDSQLQIDIDSARSKLDPNTESLQKVLMRPHKSDISLDAIGLAWMPYWKDASGNLTPTW
jgi:hypothetical protein